MRKRGLIPIPRGCDTGRGGWGGWGVCLMARKRSLRTLHSQGPSRGHSHPEHSNLLWTQPGSHGYLCMEDFSLSSTVSALPLCPEGFTVSKKISNLELVSSFYRLECSGIRKSQCTGTPDSPAIPIPIHQMSKVRPTVGGSHLRDVEPERCLTDGVHSSPSA